MNKIPCNSANNKDDESSQYGFLRKAYSAHGLLQEDHFLELFCPPRSQSQLARKNS